MFVQLKQHSKTPFLRLCSLVVSARYLKIALLAPSPGWGTGQIMKEDEKFKGAGGLATNPALHQWSERTFDLTFMGWRLY